jgi:hypothetical protein
MINARRLRTFGVWVSRPTWETGWAFFFPEAECRIPNCQRATARLSHPHQRRMKYLTKEQQTVLCVILFLLLTGLAVKTWRIQHPPHDRATATPVQKP